MQDFYFIVTFAIPPGQEPVFRQQLDAIAARLRNAPGGAGGSGTLYEVAPAVEEQLLQVPGIAAALQQRPDARASFRFVLLAHWASLGQYEAVVRATPDDTPISFPAYPAYYRLAAEYTGTASAAAPAEFTFINPFEVAIEQEHEFEPLWRSTIEQLHTAPGFISARLFAVDDAIEAALGQVPRIAGALQSRANGRARFRFIWVSQWATLAQYEIAVRAFGRGNPLPFASHPAFYQAATN
ncbi:MAG: antibiotic biosynthesis monooxygenase [Blastocatellia bacterium]|nr:antibiotic biosynthesis monooxygenase [Blastocatellia bacterium]